jgi:hypothetical protein
MQRTRRLWSGWITLVAAGSLAALGCYNTPINNSDYARGPAPLRMPSPAKQGEACSYEDSLTGGQVFSMYCSNCHNAPALSERNFANFKNVAAHMRVIADLTGKEEAKLIEFLQRWHDVPPSPLPVAPSPKRFIFSQPIAEMREQKTPPQPPGNPGLPPLAVTIPPAAPASKPAAVVPVQGGQPADPAQR